MAAISDLEIWQPVLIGLAIYALVFGGFKGRAFILCLLVTLVVSEQLLVRTLKSAIDRRRPKQTQPVRMVQLERTSPAFLTLFREFKIRTSDEADLTSRAVVSSGHVTDNVIIATMCVLFVRAWAGFISSSRRRSLFAHLSRRALAERRRRHGLHGGRGHVAHDGAAGILVENVRPPLVAAALGPASAPVGIRHELHARGLDLSSLSHGDPVYAPGHDGSFLRRSALLDVPAASAADFSKGPGVAFAIGPHAIFGDSEVGVGFGDRSSARQDLLALISRGNYSRKAASGWSSRSKHPLSMSAPWS